MNSDTPGRKLSSSVWEVEGDGDGDGAIWVVYFPVPWRGVNPVKDQRRCPDSCTAVLAVAGDGVQALVQVLFDRLVVAPVPLGKLHDFTARLVAPAARLLAAGLENSHANLTPLESSVMLVPPRAIGPV